MSKGLHNIRQFEDEVFSTLYPKEENLLPNQNVNKEPFNYQREQEGESFKKAKKLKTESAVSTSQNNKTSILESTANIITSSHALSYIDRYTKLKNTFVSYANDFAEDESYIYIDKLRTEYELKARSNNTPVSTSNLSNYYDNFNVNFNKVSDLKQIVDRTGTGYSTNQIREYGAELLKLIQIEMIGYFDKAKKLTKNPESANGMFRSMGDKLYELGLYVKAYKAYDKVNKTKNLHVHHQLAKSSYQVGDFKRANEHFVQLDKHLQKSKSGSEIISDKHEIYYDLAKNLWQLGNFSETKSKLKKALEMKSNFIEAKEALNKVENLLENMATSKVSKDAVLAGFKEINLLGHDCTSGESDDEKSQDEKIGGLTNNTHYKHKWIPGNSTHKILAYSEQVFKNKFYELALQEDGTRSVPDKVGVFKSQHERIDQKAQARETFYYKVMTVLEDNFDNVKDLCKKVKSKGFVLTDDVVKGYLKADKYLSKENIKSIKKEIENTIKIYDKQRAEINQGMISDSFKLEDKPITTETSIGYQKLAMYFPNIVTGAIGYIKGGKFYTKPIIFNGNGHSEEQIFKCYELMLPELVNHGVETIVLDIHTKLSMCENICANKARSLILNDQFTPPLIVRTTYDIKKGGYSHYLPNDDLNQFFDNLVTHQPIGIIEKAALKNEPDLHQVLVGGDIARSNYIDILQKVKEELISTKYEQNQFRINEEVAYQAEVTGISSASEEWNFDM